MAAVDLAREPPDASFDHPLSKRRYQVRRQDGQLWHRELLLTAGKDEVLLVADRLSVIALHPATHPVHQLRVRVAEVHLPAGLLRRHVGLGGRAKPTARLIHAARPVGLIVTVGLLLDGELLLKPRLRLHQPLGARARDRLAPVSALPIQALARGTQPALATLTRGELLRQLIPTTITELSILRRVRGDRLLDDRLRDLLIAHRAITVRVRRDLC